MSCSSSAATANGTRDRVHSMPLARRAQPSWAHPRRCHDVRGFSLLELLIVLVVAGIIASIALPAYQEQARKARRAEGHAALYDSASRQEEFFLNNKTYTTTVGPGGLNALSPTENGYYTITVDAPSAACLINRCYQLRATPQGNQASDSCGALTLDFDRIKNPANCW